MSQNEKLSQAEIDALLNRKQAAPSAPPVDELTAEERDGIGEIGNISFGSAATSLSVLLAQRVEITTPEIQVMHVAEVQDDFPRPYVIVTVEYTAGLSGFNALAIEIEDAKIIADLMMGGDGTNVEQELNELHLSAVSEAMNQMMGGAATAMSTMFGRPINISPPTVKFVDFSTGDTPDLGDIEWVVNTAFRLRIGNLVDSRIMQWISVTFAKELLQLAQEAFQGASDSVLQSIDQTAASAARVTTGSYAKAIQSPAEPFREPAREQVAVPTGVGPGANHAAVRRESVPVGDAAWTSPAATGVSAYQRQNVSVDPVQPVIHRPQFQEFPEQARMEQVPRNLSLLFDVPLTVTVELGRTKRPIKEILELAPGSVIELDKLAGEPVDILVNNKRIAIGEVVVIDENFGVRVTDILSPADRVRSLQFS
ncbi:flagellar motor switch phosphatase FliY [Alicyclobacillus mengziensis]|uniref:Flagellar motor switch phosphatase FliY n=1 Tax=Alicyclobacillus mengziensis TaxID=2931921 RepID=A0A9X7Z9H3_9BACL|nr:flagellar motor switch phosphatase FliY [Alicyclobacillus mengziensis]QSO49576.1 flagellar motor switch phosphatase FliY [Alicyclobacillus mengziensis]